MDIYGKLQEIFDDIFDDEGVIVTPDLDANQVEGWDSLAQIRLIEAIESEFEISFDLEELSATRNIGEMVEIIKAKCK